MLWLPPACARACVGGPKGEAVGWLTVMTVKVPSRWFQCLVVVMIVAFGTFFLLPLLIHLFTVFFCDHSLFYLHFLGFCRLPRTIRAPSTPTPAPNTNLSCPNVTADEVGHKTNVTRDDRIESETFGIKNRIKF